LNISNLEDYMKKAILGAFAALALAAGLAWGQGGGTTYQPDKTPIECSAVTTVPIQMSFSRFVCGGIFYNNGDLELSFNGGSNSVDVYSALGGWNAVGSLSLTSFSQPNPYYCPVTKNGNVYVAGCPDGTVPGTFAFTWSATDGNGTVHSGSVSGTWENIQYPGGTRFWYHPTLETAALTLN
jgi:hypothetical protein